MDKWAEWLRHRRFGGDDEVRGRLLGELVARREKVLDFAELGEGETLLDVGCGDGLIGVGALERGAGLVIFSDISSDLLQLCEQAATELNLLDRCRFLEASATDLGAVSDASVDVVTTRATCSGRRKRPASSRSGSTSRPRSSHGSRLRGMSSSTSRPIRGFRRSPRRWSRS
jgi:SAM-dependent methyltransferase